MTVTLATTTNSTKVARSQDEALSAICNPETGLSIWQRELDDRLTRTVDALGRHRVELVLSLDPHSNQAHHHIANRFETLAHCQLDPLIDDVLVLARYFTKVSMRNTVRIRIETVADDGCRFFHLDNVEMRLVTTYIGNGTQWVSPDFSKAAYQQQINYTGPLNTIDKGDVAIFKGKKNGADNLILHRSPPMQPDHSPRLVVVIDPDESEQE